MNTAAVSAAMASSLETDGKVTTGRLFFSCRSWSDQGSIRSCLVIPRYHRNEGAAHISIERVLRRSEKSAA